MFGRSEIVRHTKVFLFFAAMDVRDFTRDILG
jgi:hypothetical protein